MTPWLKKESKRRAKPVDELDWLLALYQKGYSPVLLAAAGLVSWMTSYEGILILAGWLREHALDIQLFALLISATAAGLQFALWHFAMNLLPRLETLRGWLITVFVVAVVLCFQVLASTLTGFIGLTRDNVRMQHLVDQSDLYDAQLRQVEARASKQIEFLEFLKPEAIDACGRYEAERDTGGPTGSAGPGFVTDTLFGFCTRKTVMAQGLERNIAANTARLEEMSRLVQDMDALIRARQQSIDAREDGFLARARRLDQLLREMRRADRTASFEASYKAMSSSLDNLEDALDGMSATQASALSRIATQERSSGAAIEDLMASVRAIPIPQAQRAKLVQVQKIVLENWQSYPSQLALVLVIDAFAILATLLFSAGAMRAHYTKKGQRR